MSPTTIKDWTSIAGFVLGLPAVFLGLYLLFRYWQAKIREGRLAVADMEKEKHYLLALQGHLENLNRALGYSEGH
jgi:hypothetical protein